MSDPNPNSADDAIDAATGRPDASSEVSLKRQRDADLDAELEETGPTRVLCGGFLDWRDVCLQARIPTLEYVP